MASKRKEALDALFGAISAVPVADVRRGVELPTRIPSGGLIILRDGIPGEPEVTLCPQIYEYRHRAEIEVFLQPAVGADAPAALDAVLVAIGEAIDAARGAPFRDVPRVCRGHDQLEHGALGPRNR